MDVERFRFLTLSVPHSTLNACSPAWLVLDLNRILFFIACLSPIVVLVRTARRAALNRSWRLAAIAVLAITASACLIAPRHAGYIGAGAWLVLLFLPAVGLRKAAELAAEERFANARRIVSYLRFLHPVRAVREEELILHALELAQRGEAGTALNLLARIGPNDTRAGRQAIAQSFRIRGDWTGLLTWCRGNIPRVGLGENPALLPLYFRALGETGSRDELVLQFAGRASGLLASPIHESTFLSALMLLLAFSGRTGALRSLLQTELRGLQKDAKDFWIATSEMAAGEVAAGRARLERLRQITVDALIRQDVAQRLAGGEQPAPLPLTRASEETVDRFERKAREQQRGSLLAPRSTRVTPAVVTFIALNVAMFLVEVATGGSTNPMTLHRLGALEPWAVLAGHQYWRLFGALFLHYGAIHLLFNVYALYVLGPTLEASIGTARFAICYLVAGIGSSVSVVLLWRFGWTQADFLVGASGCVMGVVGALAGWLLRHPHAPMARRRLTNIAIIVAMQTAFDLYTPQVSMTAHLGGLISGLLLGLLLAGGSSGQRAQRGVIPR